MTSPLFKIQDFKILLSCRWLQTFALQFLSVIIGWQIYQLTKQAMFLGLIGLAEAIPAIVSSFFSGHVVDNSKPAKIFQVNIFLNFLIASLIFIIVSPWADVSNTSRVVVLFIGIFITGITRSFISPAQFTLLSRIAPKNLMSSAAAFSSSSATLAQILGPAVGGLVYGFFGATIAFFIPVLLMLASFSTALLLSKNVRKFHAHESHSQKKEPMLQSIRSGFQFLLSHKVLLSSMWLDMFSVLFGGAVAVLPIFADQVYHIGATGLGILRATPAVGSVFMSLYLGLRPMPVISGSRLIFVITGFGISMIGFGLSTSLPFALIFLLASGMFDGVNMVIRGTLTQLLTPDHMRGRVSALSTVFITSSNEIGAFESGIAAQFMGLIPSVIFGGVMTLVVVTMTAWLVPELRRTRIQQSEK